MPVEALKGSAQKCQSLEWIGVPEEARYSDSHRYLLSLWMWKWMRWKTSRVRIAGDAMRFRPFRIAYGERSYVPFQIFDDGTSCTRVQIVYGVMNFARENRYRPFQEKRPGMSASRRMKYHS